MSDRDDEEYVEQMADGVLRSVGRMVETAAKFPRITRWNISILSEASDRLSELIAKLRDDDHEEVGKP